MGTTEHPNCLNIDIPSRDARARREPAVQGRRDGRRVDAIREEWIELAEWEEAIEHGFGLQADEIVEAAGCDKADFRTARCPETARSSPHSVIYRSPVYFEHLHAW